MKRKTLAIFALVVMLPSMARAAEPRPWLCRDKPVFSSTQPMHYQVTMASRSRWQLFFLQFSPGGGNDGFDIAQTSSRSATGQLAAGRYFAVALRNSGGNWICPPVVNEEPPPHHGTISELCFATDEDGCSVRLVITPDTTSSAPHP